MIFSHCPFCFILLIYNKKSVELTGFYNYYCPDKEHKFYLSFRRKDQIITLCTYSYYLNNANVWVTRDYIRKLYIFGSMGKHYKLDNFTSFEDELSQIKTLLTFSC